MQARVDPYDDLDYQRFRMDEFYEDEMSAHAIDARKRVCKDIVNPLYSSFYAEALSLAYLEGINDCKIVFDNLGLNKRHVYAILDMKERFIDELEKYNNL